MHTVTPLTQVLSGAVGVLDTINKLLASTRRALWVSASMVQMGEVPVENRDSGNCAFIGRKR